MNDRPLWAAGALLFVALLAGCSRGSSEEAAPPPPVTMETPKGTDIPVITLTARAAQRLDVHVARVGDVGGRSVIPAGAVLYDDEGKEFVYSSPKAFSFVRQAVRVDRFEGNVAVLTEGPPNGTNVVTLGAAELYGVEHGLGIAEED